LDEDVLNRAVDMVVEGAKLSFVRDKIAFRYGLALWTVWRKILRSICSVPHSSNI
jgi:hypothetical protein